MQNDWWDGGTPHIRDPVFLDPIPFPFIFLRTLLHFFAHGEILTLMFSSDSALFDKKPGVGYPLQLR